MCLWEVPDLWGTNLFQYCQRTYPYAGRRSAPLSCTLLKYGVAIPIQARTRAVPDLGHLGTSDFRRKNPAKVFVKKVLMPKRRFMIKNALIAPLFFFGFLLPYNYEAKVRRLLQTAKFFAIFFC